MKKIRWLVAPSPYLGQDPSYKYVKFHDPTLLDKVCVETVICCLQIQAEMADEELLMS